MGVSPSSSSTETPRALASLGRTSERGGTATCLRNDRPQQPAARPYAARAGQKVAELFTRGADKLRQPSQQISTNPGKSIDALRRNILEHRQKLQDYLANPDAFDNQGFLRNAPTSEIRQKIIQGRVHHLETEIRAFEKGILDLGGKL